MSARGRRRGRRSQGGGGGAGFWGDPAALPAAPQELRIIDDPSAMVRSLGPPPLAGHDAIAEHYFAVLYDKTVSHARALAAAGGLIALEELLEASEPSE